MPIAVTDHYPNRGQGAPLNHFAPTTLAQVKLPLGKRDAWRFWTIFGKCEVYNHDGDPQNVRVSLKVHDPVLGRMLDTWLARPDGHTTVQFNLQSPHAAQIEADATVLLVAETYMGYAGGVSLIAIEVDSF